MRSNTKGLLVYEGQRRGSTARVLAAQERGKAVQQGCSRFSGQRRSSPARVVLIREDNRRYSRGALLRTEERQYSRHSTAMVLATQDRNKAVQLECSLLWSEEKQYEQGCSLRTENKN
jgi:hypothetical protein